MIRKNLHRKQCPIIREPNCQTRIYRNQNFSNAIILTFEKFLPVFFKNNFPAQNFFQECFSKIFFSGSKFFPKNFTEKFQKNFRNSRQIQSPSHAVKPLPGPPIFAIHSTPDPATLRAPFGHFRKSEPFTRPDWDRPTPYLAQKSWIFHPDKGSGCAVHVGEVKFTTENAVKNTLTECIFSDVNQYLAPGGGTLAVPGRVSCGDGRKSCSGMRTARQIVLIRPVILRREFQWKRWN